MSHRRAGSPEIAVSRHQLLSPWASRTGERHAGTAWFGAACRTCPLAAQCTTAQDGRTITIGPHKARAGRRPPGPGEPARQADYKATRPKVELKIGHLMRRRHGGRRARVRGRVKVAALSSAA
jgi:hypothetical protein